MLAPLVHVGYKNPYNISNPLNITGFNPNNNFYMFFFVIFATILLFIAFKHIYYSKYRQSLKIVVIVLLMASFFLTTLLINPSYTIAGILDNFHAGEQLSVINAFLNGSSLYNNIFFLRGAGVDVVIPVLGMQIFGQSIGGFIMTMDFLQLSALFSFLVLLAFLIRNPLKYGVVSTLFYVSNAVSLIQYRDISVWIIIGLLLLLFKLKLKNLHKKVILFLIGFVSIFNLYVSIDRGTLLTLLSVLLFLSLIILSADEDNKYILCPKLWKKNLMNGPLYLIGGLCFGLLIPALLLGTDSFISFIKMTLIEIPAFAGLLVSQPIPPLFSDQYLFWAPVFIAISTGLLLIALYKLGYKKYLNKLVPYTLIFIFGVLCIKGGTNRIHITKMASVITPLYIASMLILIFAITLFLKYNKTRLKLLLPIVALLVTFCIFDQLDLSKILFQPSYNRAQLSSYKHRLDKSDDSWLNEDTKAVKKYVTENTNKNDYVFSFTSDPLYYYVTNRKNPSRFYISWYADPQPYTDELLKSLKANKPAIIIYKESTCWDAPDTIAMEARIPEVAKWINENYTTRIKLSNVILLR